MFGFVLVGGLLGEMATPLVVLFDASRCHGEVLVLLLITVLKREPLRAILRKLAALQAKSRRARCLDIQIGLLRILAAFKDFRAVGRSDVDTNVLVEIARILLLGRRHDPTILQGVIQLLYQEVYIDLEGVQLAPQPCYLHLLHLIQLHFLRAYF